MPTQQQIDDAIATLSQVRPPYLKSYENFVPGKDSVQYSGQWWDGDEIWGTVEIFSDPGPKGTVSGRIAGALVNNGLTIGISSRGMGSLKQMGEVMEVQDDFELLTWDLVSNPSNPDSWMKNGALNESRTTYLDPYARTNSIVTEILCAKGTCPIF